MKKGKNLIILGILLVSMIVIYTAVMINNKNKDNESDEDTAKTEEIMVSSVDEEGITKLIVTNENGEISLIKGLELWENEADSDIPIDQDKIKSMIDEIKEVYAVRIVDEDATNLSEYGLDNPRMQVSIILENGEEKILLIGVQTPMGGECYVALKDSTKVYLVNDSIYTQFDYSINDIIKVPSIPEISIDYLTYLEIDSKNGNDLEIRYKTNGDEADVTGLYEWFMSKPYSHTVTADKDILDNLFNSLTSITYSKCVEYNSEDLEKYGLDNPDFKTTIGYYEEIPVEEDEGTSEASESDSDVESTEGDTEEVKLPTYEYRTYTFYIGDLDEEGENYYVKEENSNTVYLLTASSVETVTKLNPYDYAIKSVLAIPLDTIEEIDIKVKEENYSVSIAREEKQEEKEEKEETDEDVENDEEEEDTSSVESKYYFNNQKVENSIFEEFYSTFSSISVDGISDPVKATSQEAEVKLTFYRNKTINNIISIEFIPYDTSFYQLKINEQDFFMLDKRTVEELITAINNCVVSNP